MARISANITELFGKLGTTSEEVQAQLGQLDRKPLAALERLSLALNEAALVEHKYARTVQDARVELPPFGTNPSPKVAASALAPFVSAGYGAAEGPALHPSHAEPFRALMDPRRQRGAKLVRLVQTNDRVRARVERAMGERIVLDGRTDNRMTVMRGGTQAVGVNTSALTSGSAMPSPPSANNFYDLFMAMDQAVMEEARRIGMGTSSGYSPQSFLDFPPLDFESGTTASTRQSEGTSLLGMTSAAPGLAPAKVDGSTDEAVMRLKRMLDKREQMYNLWRSTFDKYNEASKVAIDAMRG